MRRYRLDRKVAGSNDVVTFDVLARNAAVAIGVGDELIYAVGYHRGAFNGGKHKPSKPETWALKATDRNGVKS